MPTPNGQLTDAELAVLRAKIEKVVEPALEVGLTAGLTAWHAPKFYLGDPSKVERLALGATGAGISSASNALWRAGLPNHPTLATVGGAVQSGLLSRYLLPLVSRKLAPERAQQLNTANAKFDAHLSRLWKTDPVEVGRQVALARVLGFDTDMSTEFRRGEGLMQKRSAEGEEKPDPGHLSWKHRLGAVLGGAVGGATASSAAMGALHAASPLNYVEPSVENAPPTQEWFREVGRDVDAASALKETMGLAPEDADYVISSSLSSGGRHPHAVNAYFTPSHENPSQSSAIGDVHLPPGVARSPELIAHELGHVANAKATPPHMRSALFKFRRGGQELGRQIALPALVAATNEDYGGLVTALHAATHLPHYLEEGSATARGLAALRRTHGTGAMLRSVPALAAGFATHLGTPLMTAGAYGISKLVRKQQRDEAERMKTSSVALGYQDGCRVLGLKLASASSQRAAILADMTQEDFARRAQRLAEREARAEAARQRGMSTGASPSSYPSAKGVARQAAARGAAAEAAAHLKPGYRLDGTHTISRGLRNMGSDLAHSAQTHFNGLAPGTKNNLYGLAAAGLLAGGAYGYSKLAPGPQDVDPSADLGSYPPGMY